MAALAASASVRVREGSATMSVLQSLARDEAFCQLTLDCAAAVLETIGLKAATRALTEPGEAGRPAGSPAYMLAAADSVWERLAGPDQCLVHASMREFAKPAAGTADTPFGRELAREIRRAAERMLDPPGPAPETDPDPGLRSTMSPGG